MKVTFCGIIDKNVFLAKLGKLRNTDFGDISTGIDVPKCLLPAFFDLDSAGFNFRKENSKSSYKIGFNPILHGLWHKVHRKIESFKTW